jgi:TfoX N-terminal domain
MAYDEALAVRIRRVLEGETGIGERKMFGGLCFTASGRMCCGVLGKDLVVRVAPDGWEGALRRPHTRPMDFTGRPMRGFLYVAPRGTRDGRSLRRWVGEGVAFARQAALRRPRRPRSRPLPRRRRAGGASTRPGAR